MNYNKRAATFLRFSQAKINHRLVFKPLQRFDCGNALNFQGKTVQSLEANLYSPNLNMVHTYNKRKGHSLDLIKIGIYDQGKKHPSLHLQCTYAQTHTQNLKPENSKRQKERILFYI